MKPCHCREDQCINMAWTYHIDPDLESVMTEGQGKAFTLYLTLYYICTVIISLHLIEFHHLLSSCCYSVHPLTDENLGVFLDGSWIKCPSCLIVAKLHSNTGFLRIMLFGQFIETALF